MKEYEYALKTEGLTKKFGGYYAVSGLTLDIKRGEIFAITGAGGAGKSTILKMICGVIKADSGTVFVNGAPAYEGKNTILTEIGFCPQNFPYWSFLTCIEQLICIASIYGIDEKEAAKEGEKLLFEIGLYEKRNLPSGSLSGGEKKRLSFAIAMINNPEIVVLDEPLAGLDEQNESFLRNYIKSLAVNRTVILTSHSIKEVEEICDSAAVIERGRLISLNSFASRFHSTADRERLEIVFEDKRAAEKTALLLSGSVENLSVCENSVILLSESPLEQLPGILLVMQVEGARFQEIRLSNKLNTRMYEYEAGKSGYYTIN
jgi:ABC-2 type transport system ATP-binding protein